MLAGLCDSLSFFSFTDQGKKELRERKKEKQQIGGGY
jgi:hypothetical protein